MPPAPPTFYEVTLQPHIHGETVVLHAPTQVWSAPDGSLGSSSIHGIYHSDIRVLAVLQIEVSGGVPEPVASDSRRRADALRAVGLLRHLDPGVDPTLRMSLDRTVDVDGVSDRITLSSRRNEPVDAEVRVTLLPDLTPIDRIKAGLGSGPAPSPRLDGEMATWSNRTVETRLNLTRAQVTAASDRVEGIWRVQIPPRGEVSVGWHLSVTDSRAAVTGVNRPAPWSTPVIETVDARLARWVSRSLEDLGSLLLTTGSDREAVFLGAGAPWYLTLFGRDSLWAARMLLPLGTDLAAGTLRILAGMQGSDYDVVRAEEPGKILHELRRHDDTLPSEALPPLYYGTVDATPLWINLLADAWRWGMPDTDVEPLLVHLEAALRWLRLHGDADGDGLLEYIDASGTGLSNQGWKDSSDSVQWQDGSFAEGPIALVEVQGYAYEAALSGAELLDQFGRDGAHEVRAWAARLKERFDEAFWVEDERGSFPAIAVDAHKRPVDSLTSNIGHLLGTGILGPDQAARIVQRLTTKELDSGYGLRTLSTGADGYWPLSYHGGSVWPHDTAIVVAGMVREGFGEEASSLIDGLLAAAEGFDYRLPELYSGDPRSEMAVPVPYPAACRPQAWSAAASVAVLSAVLGLRPDGDRLTVRPTRLAHGSTVSRLRFRGNEVQIGVGHDGDLWGTPNELLHLER